MDTINKKNKLDLIREIKDSGINRKKRIEQVLLNLDDDEVQRFFQLCFYVGFLKNSKGSYFKDKDISKVYKDGKCIGNCLSDLRKSGDSEATWKKIEKALIEFFENEYTELKVDLSVEDNRLLKILSKVDLPDMRNMEGSYYLDSWFKFEKAIRENLPYSIQKSREDLYQLERVRLGEKFFNSELVNCEKYSYDRLNDFYAMFDGNYNILMKSNKDKKEVDDLVFSVLLKMSQFGGVHIASWVRTVNTFLSGRTTDEQDTLLEKLGVPKMKEELLTIKNDNEIIIDIKKYRYLGNLNELIGKPGITKNLENFTSGVKILSNPGSSYVNEILNYIVDTVAPVLDRIVPEFYQNIEKADSIGQYIKGELVGNVYIKTNGNLETMNFLVEVMERLLRDVVAMPSGIQKEIATEAVVNECLMKKDMNELNIQVKPKKVSKF